MMIVWALVSAAMQEPLPSDPEPLNATGNSAFIDRDFERAYLALSKSLKVKPDRPGLADRIAGVEKEIVKATTIECSGCDGRGRA